MNLKDTKILSLTVLFYLLFILTCSAPTDISTPPVSNNVTVKPPVQNDYPCKIQNGEIAPDFTLNDIYGNEVNLNKLRGHKIVLNLWWIKCHGCTDELPYFQEFYEKYKEQGLILIAINNYEREPTIKSYIEGKGYTYTVIADSNKELHKAYTNWGFPTTFFIDEEGVVRARKDAGFASIEEIESIYISY